MAVDQQERLYGVQVGPEANVSAGRSEPLISEARIPEGWASVHAPSEQATPDRVPPGHVLSDQALSAHASPAQASHEAFWLAGRAAKSAGPEAANAKLAAPAQLRAVGNGQLKPLRDAKTRIATAGAAALLTMILMAKLTVLGGMSTSSGSVIATVSAVPASRAAAGTNTPVTLAPPPPPVAKQEPVDQRVLTMRIQEALKRRGYEPGAADGVAGLVTRAAIIAYEFDHARALTGLASTQLFNELVTGQVAASGRVRVRDIEPAASAVITKVQRSLKSIGYDVSEIDGGLSNRTRRAVGDFEADQGLPETGRVSGRLMARLIELADRGKLALR